MNAYASPVNKNPPKLELVVENTENLQPVGKEAKPKLFSWTYWKLIFGAVNVFKYSPREWGIYNYSTAMTWGSIYGIFKPVSAFLAEHFGWVVPVLKALWVKVTAAAVALFHVFSN